MKTVYLVYAADQFHTKATRVLIGVGTTLQKGLYLADQHATDQDPWDPDIGGRDVPGPLTRTQVDDLARTGQTQGRGTNYAIETIEVNKPLAK